MDGVHIKAGVREIGGTGRGMVVANKCCHARAMPAGGLDVASAGPENAEDAVQQLRSFRWQDNFLATCCHGLQHSTDQIRIQNRRDQKWTNKRNTSS